MTVNSDKMSRFETKRTEKSYSCTGATGKGDEYVG
nr:MAG TPA: hypothetical protein [Caudoviricetes sp.]